MDHYDYEAWLRDVSYWLAKWGTDREGILRSHGLSESYWRMKYNEGLPAKQCVDALFSSSVKGD